MATIEPRLIHLLNESTTTPRRPNTELPSIKHLPYPQTTPRPHPIEPGAAQAVQRYDELDASGIPTLYSLPDDVLTVSSSSSSRKDKCSYIAVERPYPSLVSQDLRMILEDSSENPDDLSTKKRPVKEDFPQLPQPLKKQKAAQHMFPPIIVGLLEPPSNAALFPPISSGSFDDRPRSEPPQALSISKPQEAQCVAEETAGPSPSADLDRTPTGKVKRRAAKPRRKWSEEETNHLLLGVSKHGVGKWTDILEDPMYNFRDRTAGDLKDRFRTCCPAELRGSAASKGGDGSEQPTASKTEKRPKKGLMSENILNDTEEEVDGEKSLQGQTDYDLAPKQRKSRAHRKKLEDLAELGIKGPFKKSQRRERRPFSEQDDREILQGFELYGPHWTKIQRDPRFNLSTRQPTDLRDRLRNKYPEKFVGTEKTTMQIRGTNLLEPSVNMAIKNSLDLSKSSLLESQLNRTVSREDMLRWPLATALPEASDQSSFQSNMMWSNDSGGGFPSGEMDISRLLLDDSQVIGDPLPTDRRGFG